jgi:hypothetical protein
MHPLQRPLRRAAGAVSCSLFLAAAGCPGLACSSGGDAGGTGTASAAASASASASAAPEDSAAALAGKTKEEDIKPLYPLDNSPPDPQAVRFCEAIHDLEPRRRGECCGSPGSSGHFTGECARVLSSAIKLGAIKLDSAAVDACTATSSKSMEGCGWVGASPPELPAECESVITGLVGEMQVCRSSLECTGTLACQGLTTTRAGKCLPPKPTGMVCGGTVDTLAALTRQNRTVERHRECAGFCARPICIDALPLGGACKADGECGPDRRCLDGKCSDSPLPAAGKPCSGGQCAAGARCVKGSCLTPKEEGQVCEVDQECRGACDRPAGAAAGKCGKRCPVTTIPTKPAFQPKQPPPKR